LYTHTLNTKFIKACEIRPESHLKPKYNYNQESIQEKLFNNSLVRKKLWGRVAGGHPFLKEQIYQLKCTVKTVPTLENHKVLNIPYLFSKDKVDLLALSRIKSKHRF